MTAPGEAQAAAARRRFRRLVYPLAATIGVSFGAVLFGFSVLITRQAAGGEFSSSVLSGAFAGSVLAGGATVLVVGRVVDHRGVRAVLAVGATLVAAGFGVFAIADASWQVLVGWWLLVGPGSAMVLFDPAFIALQRWFDRHDRNRAAGTLTLVTGLAGPLFVPATTAGVAVIGWRPTAALLGAVVAGVGWATAGIALRNVPPPTDPTAAARPPWSRAALTDPRFLLVTGAIVAALAAMEAVQVHRIARFEATGFSPATLAWWAAVASLLSLPGRFVVPRLASRFDSAAILLVVTVLLLPAVALAVRGTTSWEMVGHFSLFGLLFGATIPLRPVVMGDWFGGAGFGGLMGAQGAAIALGRSFGPGAVGWLRDATGGYMAGMGLLVALLAVSVVLLAAASRVATTGAGRR